MERPTGLVAPAAELPILQRLVPASWILLLTFLVFAFGNSPERVGTKSHIVLTGGTAVVAGLALALAVALLPWPRWGEAGRAWSSLIGVMMFFPLQAGLVPWDPSHGILILVPLETLTVFASRRMIIWGTSLAVASLWLPVAAGDHSWVAIAGDGVLISLLLVLATTSRFSVMEVLRRQAHFINDLAHTDPLTAIPNRRGWDAELPLAISRARRAHAGLSIVLCDLDDFKAFNDSHGHAAGDRLLMACAAAWRAAIRDIDVVTRWGGDEFAFIFPEWERSDMEAVLDRLRVATPPGGDASFGAATWDRSESAETLLHRADTALYESKERRRGEGVHHALRGGAAEPTSKPG